MKTFVLIVSQRFPQTHKRKGENTYFPGQILDGIKIHTIRANYDLWAKRIAMINKGEALLSVRHWSDKPYRSPQIEFDEYTTVGIEKLTFKHGRFHHPLVNGEFITDGMSPTFAKNDGLSFVDFNDWFRGYDLTKPMAIIHFTNFRYSNP